MLKIRNAALALLLICAALAASCCLLVRRANAGDDARSTVKLVFVGDMMLAHDEETGKLVAKGTDPFSYFADVLKDADVAVGNLECVVAGKGEPAGKPFEFRADPGCIPLLLKHFSAVTLANNHSEDFGQAAFLEQCDRLERAGLPYFGGGRNRSEAHRPWIVERNGVRIAMLGYNETYSPLFEAKENLPGVARSDDDEVVVADIKAARERHRADIVIPFMHWGWQYQEAANDRQKALARKMIDAGADVVIGAHPHVTQGTDDYNGHLIVYSLGNFVFNGFDTEATTNAWVLRLTLEKKGVVEWNTIAAHLDEHGLPHPGKIVTSSP